MFSTDEKQILKRILLEEPGLSPEAVNRLFDEILSRDFSFPGDSARSGRWDHEVIESLIPREATVLDLGCGSGELLGRLTEHKSVFGQGVEKDSDLVLACIRSGVPVIQADLDRGLGFFATGLFDYVVLEETLQMVRRPVRVLQEMMRVGKVAIVSFPNFGHWRVRMQLLVEGRMPRTTRLPHAWYETPNIHLTTIRDFENLCQQYRFFVAARYAFGEDKIRPLIPEDNLLAEEALYVLSPRGPIG